MISRLPVRGRRLADRLRALFARAAILPVDPPRELDALNWDAEDYLELPTAGLPVEDPWEAAAGRCGKDADPEEPGRGLNKSRDAPSDRAAGSTDGQDGNSPATPRQRPRLRPGRCTQAQPERIHKVRPLGPPASRRAQPNQCRMPSLLLRRLTDCLNRVFPSLRRRMIFERIFLLREGRSTGRDTAG